MNKAARLHRILNTGDIELRFKDNRTIRAHSQKLKIASLDGCLHHLIELKRKRADSDETDAIPSLEVSHMSFDTKTNSSHSWLAPSLIINPCTDG